MLNLLRASRCNPKFFAYAILEGEFNFNKTPLVPPGSKTLVYKDTKMQTSFAPHAKDAWYIGSAMQHYRCYKFWLPETRGTRIIKTAKFFPLHCTMSIINEGDAAILTSKELVDILRNPQDGKNCEFNPFVLQSTE